jgi:hypothetical protein
MIDLELLPTRIAVNISPPIIIIAISQDQSSPSRNMTFFNLSKFKK